MNIKLKLFYCFVTDKDPSEYIARHYHVGQMLGSGGFGTVFSGIRRKDNLPVSITFYLIFIFTFLLIKVNVRKSISVYF